MHDNVRYIDILNILYSVHTFLGKVVTQATYRIRTGDHLLTGELRYQTAQMWHKGGTETPQARMSPCIIIISKHVRQYTHVQIVQLLSTCVTCRGFPAYVFESCQFSPAILDRMKQHSYRHLLTAHGTIELPISTAIIDCEFALA